MLARATDHGANAIPGLRACPTGRSAGVTTYLGLGPPSPAFPCGFFICSLRPNTSPLPSTSTTLSKMWSEDRGVSPGDRPHVARPDGEAARGMGWRCARRCTQGRIGSGEAPMILPSARLPCQRAHLSAKENGKIHARPPVTRCGWVLSLRQDARNEPERAETTRPDLT